jgi:Tol biopolymer transport system component
VDRRADIWAFGVIVWEMVTGERLFGGETISDTLAAVLRAEPDWEKLPVDEAPLLCRLIERCLVRDPQQRLRDIGEARILLQSDASDISRIMPAPHREERVSHASRAMRWLPWGISAIAVLTLVLARGGRAPSQEEAVSHHLTIPITGMTRFGGNLAAPPVVSPDGRWVAYGMTDDKGVDQLWLRPIDSFEAQPLAGTEGANFAFWSPDGKHVGFFDMGLLKRIEVASGRIQTIGGERTISVRGANWGANDDILFVPNSNTGVWIVDAAGGETRQITTPDPNIPDASHRWPHFLPDGEHYLFLLWTNDAPSLEQFGGVYLASITSDAEPVRILPDASSVAYASRHLLVMQGNNLVAVPFDASKLRVNGEASIATDGVLFNRNNGHAAFSASSEGTLVYARDLGTIPNASFLWSDRDGNTTRTAVESAPMFPYARLSPNGERVATLMPGSTGDAEVWVVDLRRGVRTRLVPPAPWHYDSPIWSPAGDRILYVSAMKGTWDFYIRNIDGSGTEEPFLINSSDKAAYDWHDDRVLYIGFAGGGVTGRNNVYDVTTKESNVLFDSPGGVAARFSPDGRFITYSLSEAGRPEIFIQSIESGARSQVSTSGGESPHWSDNGSEIVYIDRERRMMAVSVDLRADGVTLGRAQELFQLDRSVFAWDITGDHQRFLFAERPERVGEPVHVILNWDAEL